MPSMSDRSPPRLGSPTHQPPDSSTNPNTPKLPGSSTNPNTPSLSGIDRTEPINDEPVKASPSPDSSTKPKVPKSPELDRTGPTNDESVKASSSPPDSTSSIQPTWPKLVDIDVTKAEASAEWSNGSLSNLFLDLRWHPSSHRAFFKLCAKVGLPARAGGRRVKTSIYIYIYPERIRQLSVDPDPTQRKLGAGTILLRVELNRPPALVMPETALDVNSNAAERTIDALRGLAGQTCFAMHAKIPRKKLSVARIRELCAAAANAGLTSLAAHANTANLYHGKGGHVVEGDSLAGPPPQYVDLAPAEPLPPRPPESDHKGKKRRRADSSGPETSGPASLEAVQALLDSSLSSLRQHFDDRLASHKGEVLGLLDTFRKDMQQQYNGVQEELDQKVREGLGEIEDNIMRTLSETPLTASLTFPQHPWY